MDSKITITVKWQEPIVTFERVASGTSSRLEPTYDNSLPECNKSGTTSASNLEQAKAIFGDCLQEKESIVDLSGWIEPFTTLSMDLDIPSFVS